MFGEQFHFAEIHSFLYMYCRSTYAEEMQRVRHTIKPAGLEISRANPKIKNWSFVLPMNIFSLLVERIVQCSVQ